MDPRELMRRGELGVSPAERTHCVDPLNLNQVILAEGIEMSDNLFDTKVLAEIAILTSLSAALSYIKIWEMPQGGSITIGSMVPLLLLAMRRGPKAGITGGILSGLIQMFFGGFIWTPVQAALDYPIAFGCIGLAGFFRKNVYIGTTVALFGRFLSHFVSGVVFFGAWAPPEFGAVLYSLIYNGEYMLPELIVSGVMMYYLLKRGIQNLRL